jgi:hypothetical protein
LPALEYETRHPDYTAEFPQSGEQFTRDGLRALQEAYPGGPPAIRVRRLTGSGDVWVLEATMDYADGKRVHGVSVLEFLDGRVRRDTRHFAEPFEVPAWRRQ